MADINELKQDRFSLIQKARGILDEAEKREDKNLTAEERSMYDNIYADVDKLTDRIKDEEKQREAERFEVEKREVTKPDGQKPPDNREQNKIEIPEQYDTPEMRKLYKQYGTPEYREFFGRFLTGRTTPSETRALQVDSDTAGGYIVAPLQFQNELIKAKDNLVFIRRLSRAFSVPNAESLGAPSLDNDPADPAWTSEIAIGTEDSTMTFGKRELKPHPLGKYIKVSNTLLRKAMMGAEALVRDRLAYKFAVTEENAFLNGSGALQPLGIFTASDSGVSTSRDVSTGNTTTEIRTDNLKEVKYTLPQQYRSNCIWIFHRDAIKQIAKLKDGEGRYIWQPAITAGTPDRLESYPVYESEYAPNTFTTGLYVGILFDPNYYWIADALSMTMQKLVELYAATNQVGFIGRSETDGMPVLESAYVRVKLA